MSGALPVGLQRRIRDEIKAIWAARWPAGIATPVVWRENAGSTDTGPDPTAGGRFLDLEVDFGVERVRAFGGGRGQAERLKFGSVLIRVLTVTGEGDDEALDLMSAAEAVFRSQRVGALSFIGSISGFDESRATSGNWFQRASMAAWEYRFRG